MSLPECFIMKTPEPHPDTRKLHIELASILDDMDVPKHREQDFHWLNRNLSIRNSTHPNFPEAMKIIKELLKNWN